MYPSLRLKLSAVSYAVAWTICMLCWNGPFDRANLIVTSVCGAACGYLWYRLMRARGQRSHLRARLHEPYASEAAS